MTYDLRYDIAPHHNVSTFPHHKHLADRIDESRAVSFLEVLRRSRNADGKRKRVTSS
jgi:hypothetical protein